MELKEIQRPALEEIEGIVDQYFSIAPAGLIKYGKSYKFMLSNRMAQLFMRNNQKAIRAILKDCFEVKNEEGYFMITKKKYDNIHDLKTDLADTFTLDCEQYSQYTKPLYTAKEIGLFD